MWYITLEVCRFSLMLFVGTRLSESLLISYLFVLYPLTLCVSFSRFLLHAVVLHICIKRGSPKLSTFGSGREGGTRSLLGSIER